MALNKEEDLISKCKQLPSITTVEECMEFYKKFFEFKLYDPKYGDEGRSDFNNKPFEELTLDEVLTSLTVIQREHYWEGGYDSTFERYLENGTFEKLYKRLQILCA